MSFRGFSFSVNQFIDSWEIGLILIGQTDAMNNKIFLILFFATLVILPGQQGVKSQEREAKRGYSFGNPKAKLGDDVIVHTGYSVLYNHTFMQAVWVSYELTREKTTPVVKRSNRFVPDPMVHGGTATNTDYRNSGYDKGHLAPAADMCWSQTAMQESFYFSNISPQKPEFNRGIWKMLEEKVRDWAVEYGDLCIVTGPLLSHGLPVIGIHQLAVPEYFYKVVAEIKPSHSKGIGFVMRNEKSGERLQQFAISIDSVEKLTGINFFPLLTKEQEKAVEAKVDLKSWSWVSDH
jgi:endonuclease G, mitochondrial